MKIIVIGATGTIGREVVKALSADHEVVRIALKDADIVADITSKASIESMYRHVGPFDAVASPAGYAKFGMLDELTDEDYLMGLTNKLMGQVNLVRIGRNYINDNGSFTLTSGVLSQEPMPGSTSLSMVNAAIEGFVRAGGIGDEARGPYQRREPDLRHRDCRGYGTHDHPHDSRGKSRACVQGEH